MVRKGTILGGSKQNLSAWKIFVSSFEIYITTGSLIRLLHLNLREMEKCMAFEKNLTRKAAGIK